MNDVLLFATILTPIVTALIQLLKNALALPKNLVPLIGFVVAVAVGAVGYSFTDLGLVDRLWAGGIAGLSAVGLFELALNNRAGYTGAQTPTEPPLTPQDAPTDTTKQ